MAWNIMTGITCIGMAFTCFWAFQQILVDGRTPFEMVMFAGCWFGTMYCAAESWADLYGVYAQRRRDRELRINRALDKLAGR